MEDAVLTGHLKLIEVTFLYRLVKGEDDLAFFHRCSDDLWRECHLMMIDKTVETDTDTFCDFLLAQGVDIYSLTQIIDDRQFCALATMRWASRSCAQPLFIGSVCGVIGLGKPDC